MTGSTTEKTSFILSLGTLSPRKKRGQNISQTIEKGNKIILHSISMSQNYNQTNLWSSGTTRQPWVWIPDNNLKAWKKMRITVIFIHSANVDELEGYIRFYIIPQTFFLYQGHWTSKVSHLLVLCQSSRVHLEIIWRKHNSFNIQCLFVFFFFESESKKMYERWNGIECTNVWMI